MNVTREKDKRGIWRLATKIRCDAVKSAKYSGPVKRNGTGENVTKKIYAAPYATFTGNV
jgi:hypothetical protein